MGITKPVSPVYPDYSKINNKRMPDFWSSLYFSSFKANLKSNSSQSVSNSFYTSDDVGEYVVRVMGHTKKGTAFYFEKSFNVSY